MLRRPRRIRPLTLPYLEQQIVFGSTSVAVPGGGAALQVGAHATLQGTLATAAAQLQLQARLKPEPTSEDSE